MGGVISHIQHPYENLDLTFYNLHEMICQIMDGQIDATEKLDGQQLSVSWKEGKGLLVARNKGHLKNFGENALNLKELKKKFKNHVCYNAFVKAFQSLEFTLSALSINERFEIFADGKRWLSLEVLHPDTTNVIPYNKKRLYFHYTVEYDENGNFVEIFPNDGQKLWDMLPDSNIDEYTFHPPQKITLPNNGIRVIGFLNQLKPILENETPTSNQTIGEFLEYKFHEILYSHLNLTNTEYSVELGLVRRFARGDKTFTMNQIKKVDPALAEWVKKYESTELKFDLKRIRYPLEKLFIELGAYVLTHSDEKYFVSKNDFESERELKNRVVEESNAIEIVNRRLAHQLYLLKEVLGSVSDGVTATEGIVFPFKGELYKLTGCFAPINQILGERRF